MGSVGWVDDGDDLGGWDTCPCTDGGRTDAVGFVQRWGGSICGVRRIATMRTS